MLDTHLADIDHKLADLRRLRDSLRNVRRAATTARREGNAAVVCQIIESAPDPPAREPSDNSGVGVANPGPGWPTEVGTSLALPRTSQSIEPRSDPTVG